MHGETLKLVLLNFRLLTSSSESVITEFS